MVCSYVDRLSSISHMFLSSPVYTMIFVKIPLNSTAKLEITKSETTAEYLNS